MVGMVRVSGIPLPRPRFIVFRSGELRLSFKKLAFDLGKMRFRAYTPQNACPREALALGILTDMAMPTCCSQNIAEHALPPGDPLP